MSEVEQTSSPSVAATAEKLATPAIKAILGRKLGMTQIVKPSGEIIAVTVLQAGPCPVLQVKTIDNDGYNAVQLGFGTAKKKNVSQPMIGHFEKAGVAPVQWIREVRLPGVDGFQAGQDVLVTNFSPGDIVDISGTSKGKGFAGVVKRHRFKGGPATHGQSDRERAPGSLGGQQPQRVFRGLRGPGHMGAEWITVQCLEVVGVEAEINVLLIHGAVPGPDGGYVSVKQTTRPRRAKKTPVLSAAAAKKAAKPVKTERK